MTTFAENIEVLQMRPKGFSPEVEVAAACVEVNGKILFLQRNDSEKGLWGLPAGKTEKGETPEEAMKRELFEETGIWLEKETEITFLGKLYIRKPHVDYVFHIFRLNFVSRPPVQLSVEHQDFGWFSPKEIESLPLMAGAFEAFAYFRRWESNKARSGTHVNVLLILKRNDEVLLYLRKNTGYCDGFYGLLGGHVEEGEAATEALIREAQEEAGIILLQSDLRFVHCSHCQTNRRNVNLFFECNNWKGLIANQETDKCEELRFFPINRLPSNTIGYLTDVLKAVEKGQHYSEWGWKSES